MKTKTNKNKPFVLTAADKQELFSNALQRAVNQAKEQYEDARSRFLEEAAINPGSAIEWGESVVRAQHRLRQIGHASHCVLNHVGEGKQFANRREALTHVADDLRRTLILGATGGRSTSELSNGVKSASLAGANEALSDVEYLLGSDFH